MKKNIETQNTSKNSKGTAMATRKVSIIEIDLTNSTNKVEDFRKRVQSSANNINRFPEAEVIVDFEKKSPNYGGQRNIIQKYGFSQTPSGVYLVDGDKRRRETHRGCVHFGFITGLKSQWLLDNAKGIIMGMSLFDKRYSNPDMEYSESLGVTREELRQYFKVLFPQTAMENELDNAIDAATTKVMEHIKGLMVEEEMVDDYRILKANDWGIAIEFEDGSLDVARWDNVSFFLPFKRDLDFLFREYSKGMPAKTTSFVAWDDEVSLSLVKGKAKNKVILFAGEMSETFNADDYAGMYMWVYENRHEIGKPKEEILTYAGLYGTDKVEDVVPIAKEVLTPGVRFVRDNRTYLVVYRDDIGVTLQETTSVITGGSPFNNTHIVSFDWNDFSNWNHMPTDDMCTIDKQWRVKDGIATLVEEPVSDNSLRKVA